jgi:hypothetical protein
MTPSDRWDTCPTSPTPAFDAVNCLDKQKGLSFHNYRLVERWSLLHVEWMDACEEDQFFRVHQIDSSADDMIFSLDHLYCSLTIDAFKNQTNDSSSDVMSEKRQDRSRGSLKERGRQAFVAFSRNLGFHAGVFQKRDGLRKAPLENGSRRT